MNKYLPFRETTEDLSKQTDEEWTERFNDLDDEDRIDYLRHCLKVFAQMIEDGVDIDPQMLVNFKTDIDKEENDQKEALKAMEVYIRAQHATDLAADNYLNSLTEKSDGPGH